MKTNIKVVFKDNRECLFDANSFMLGDRGFYDLIFVDEKDNEKCVACVSISEIKYLMFVEVKEWVIRKIITI